MSAPIAYLRREAGVLVAEAPLMPCEGCELSELCGPDYPCPEMDFDPEPEEEKAEAPSCSACEYETWLASSDEYDCGYTGAGCAFIQ